MLTSFKRSSLVAVGHDVTINENREISKNVSLRFTDSRGPTQLGNLQGDHVTAYSLYVECAITIVKKYILDNARHEGLSSLLKDMAYISRQDKSLLKDLVPSLTNEVSDKFLSDELISLELLGRFLAIRQAFDARAEALSMNITAINALKGLVAHSPAVVEYSENIHKLDVGCLKKEIIEIRGEYFFIIAQEIAEAYLLFQNKAPYVAFEKIPGQNADKGEGGRIAGALSALRNKDGKDSLALASHIGHTRLASRYPPRDRKSSIEAQTARISEIVEHINTLLFYPKISSQSDVGNEQELEENDLKRTNDKDIFCYVIARHLLIVFAAFKNLTENQDEKRDVMKAFISSKCMEWKFSKKSTSEIENRIIFALKKVQELPYEIDGEEDQMNVSMGMDGIADLRLSPIISPYKKKIGQAFE